MTQADGPVAGKGAKVTFDGTFIDGMTEWKIDPKTDKKDITVMRTGNNAAWRKYLATLKDATISITLAFADLTDPGQKKLWDNLMLDGGVKEIKLYEDATHYIFCDAFVETFPVGSKVDDVEGTGTSITLQISDDDGVQLPA